MMHNENPAAALGGTGLPKIVQLGGFERTQVSPPAPEYQGDWVRVRDLERRSNECARNGLMQRGADRFVMLALASTYAKAALAAGCIAGVTQ